MQNKRSIASRLIDLSTPNKEELLACGIRKLHTISKLTLGDIEKKMLTVETKAFQAINKASPLQVNTGVMKKFIEEQNSVMRQGLAMQWEKSFHFKLHA